MNLKEVLDYRNNCLLCSEPMVLSSYDLAGITLSVDVDGLTATTGLNKQCVKFRYDGTYERLERWSSIYVRPLSLIKECHKCNPEISSFKNKRVSLKSVTLKDLFNEECSYVFSLNGQPDGTYSSILEKERIYGSDDAVSIQMDTSFIENTSVIIKGLCYSDEEETDIFSLHTAAIKTNNLSCFNELLDKISLYNVFS